MMVGETLHTPEREAGETGEVLLEVTKLSLAPANQFGTRLKEVSFTLRAGEVLGIAGVAAGMEAFNMGAEISPALERRIDA